MDWIERQWGRAIGAWLDGDCAKLVDLLRGNREPIPNDARAFLADLAAGKVSRGKGGRPTEYDGWVERAIVAEVFAEWDKAKAMPFRQRMKGPKDFAVSVVARRRATTQGSIRGVVDKLIKVGITRERWQAWGRPAWKNK